MLHWCLHGWAPYVVDGLILALVSYKLGLSMNERSCLYPIVGKGIFGFFGELIDSFSIITTLFGVCTSLGLGVMQLNTGFHSLSIRLKGDVIPDENIGIQIMTIILITCVATISCVTGIK